MSASREGSARDWVVVLACLVCQIGMGIGGYVFPVFLKPIAEELGWSRATYSLANPVMSTSVALAGPMIGRLTEWRGPRVVLVIGAFLMSAGLLATGGMQTSREFYAIAVVIGLAIACLGDLPTAAAIADRFRSRPGLALGSVYIGSNIGGAFGSLLATTLAATLSWRGAFAAMGGTLWLVLLPFALLVPRPTGATRLTDDFDDRATTKRADGDHAPEVAGLEHAAAAAEVERIAAATGDAVADIAASAAGGSASRQALRTRDFWLLFWAIFAFYAYRLGVNTHLVAFLSDLGYSDATAAGGFSAMLMLGIVGKLLTGSVADRIGARAAAIANFTMVAVASALLLVPAAPLALPAFLLLHGFATAAEDVVVPLVVRKRFGAEHLASIYGLLLLALVPGGIAGPLVAGWAFDVTGSYAGVFSAFFVGNVTAVLALFALGARRTPGPAPDR